MFNFLKKFIFEICSPFEKKEKIENIQGFETIQFLKNSNFENTTKKERGKKIKNK
jgi:hypothetical protein